MESLVILVIAAGLSAAVVWWAMAPPEGSSGVRAPTKASVPEPSTPLADEPRPDGFVLMPTDEPVVPDDRPPPALSLLRLALTITFVAALGVAALTILGWLVKIQLDQYFSRLGS
jgi:hypothetical protein